MAKQLQLRKFFDINSRKCDKVSKSASSRNTQCEKAKSLISSTKVSFTAT